jgi:hypothetical protein
MGKVIDITGQKFGRLTVIQQRRRICAIAQKLFVR